MTDENQVNPVDIKISTIVIYTEKIIEMASFYQDGLDLPPFEQFGPRHMGQHLGSVYFGFDSVQTVDGESPSAVTVWFEVPDLQATYDRFLTMGAAVRIPPKSRPWGDIIASVHDPDGNIIGLAQKKEPVPDTDSAEQ